VEMMDRLRLIGGIGMMAGRIYLEGLKLLVDKPVECRTIFGICTRMMCKEPKIWDQMHLGCR
jgi:hypothetical protein